MRELLTTARGLTLRLDHRPLGWGQEDAYGWAIMRGDARVIGSVAITTTDAHHQTAVCSYLLDDAYDPQRYAADALRTLCLWAFADLNLYRLELDHPVDEPGLCRVGLNAGFAIEGTARGRVLADGTRRDLERHARLATDPEPPPARGATAGTAFTVEPMRSDDAEAVLAIYQQGIDTRNATFETSAPDWAAFDAGRSPEHRFVARDKATGEVLGWAACSPASPRSAYAGVVEHSVYVGPAAQGRGAGRALLDALVESTEAAGIWCVSSGIFPENVASLALHRAAGFRVVGTRIRVGHHYGRFRDVVLVERRSTTVGSAGNCRAQ